MPKKIILKSPTTGQEVRPAEIAKQLEISKQAITDRLARWERGEIEYEEIFAPRAKKSNSPWEVYDPEIGRSISVQAFADMRGVHPSTVRRWVKQGKVKRVK